MKIKPAPGRAARHPGSFRLLSEAGETVIPSPYWHRLLANGDVKIVADEESVLTITAPPDAPPQDAPHVEETEHAQ